MQPIFWIPPRGIVSDYRHKNTMSNLEEKKLDQAISVSSGALAGDVEHLQRRNDETISRAIEGLGFGRYQWQMFLTCGFGFMLDQV